MKKHLFIKMIILNVSLCIMMGSFTLSISANNEFDGKEDYYTRKCLLTAEDNKECKAFEAYLGEKQKHYEKELSDINVDEEEIKNNVQKYVDKINSFNKEIEIIDGMIQTLESESMPEETILESITDTIKEKLAKYDAEYNDLKSRLVKLQGYIGTNYYLKTILQSEKPFEIYYRKEQLNELFLYDKEKLNDLKEVIKDIDKEKSQYSSKTEKIEKQKLLLSDSKSLVANMREKANKIFVVYKQQEAEIVAKKTKKVENLDEVKATIKKTENINDIKNENWISPIRSGQFTVSAGVWNYPVSFGGGIHLGADLAAVDGTDVVAPANSIVLFSSNTCPNVGQLGDMCGSPGAYGGGNQVYLLTSVNGNLFVLSFAHLQYDTVLKIGTLVNAGDKIAAIGSTGNSTGNHTHLEMYYVGKDSPEDFVKKWNGDLSFQNKWGKEALNNICEDTLDKSHCRVNPVKYLGL